jgi:ATP-dependent DNA helicase 2 subunit 2
MEIVSLTYYSACALLTQTVLSDLAVAIHMIDTATRGAKGNPLKYDRRIIIVTDGRGEMVTDDLEQLTSKIKDPEAPFEITLLGIDFDDPDVGFKEENKDPQKVVLVKPSHYVMANQT